MNFSGLTYLTSIALALAGYIITYFTASTMPTPVALAVGTLIGGIVVPFISTRLTGSTQQSNAVTDDVTTLYVGNLPYKVNETDVMTLFSQYGYVQSVRLMKDRRTGKRKGYGFVEFDSGASHTVIQQLNDSEFQGRTLKVRLAKDKSEQE